MDELDRREFLVKSALLTGALATRPSLAQSPTPTLVHSAATMEGMSATMKEMEHPKVTLFVPPLVDERILTRFCQAVQSYADAQGNPGEAAARLRELRARLSNLRNLASLCRLAILGHPHSFLRVIDEMNYISSDFPREPFEPPEEEEKEEKSERDDRVQLSAAIDLLAGAAFVSKNDHEQRNRFIICMVRAIAEAIAFPVTFADEAATYLGQKMDTLAKSHASIVIANATQRLLQSDRKGVPEPPVGVRTRLERLAHKWMRANPVTEFFNAVTGPPLAGILESVEPDDAGVADLVTLRLRPSSSGEKILHDVGVMFCPHEPAAVVQVLKHGLQVRVPAKARTGPIAIVRKGGASLFTHVIDLLTRYADEYPVEWLYSVFSFVPMPRWAYPTAFGEPIIEIKEVPRTATLSAFTSSGELVEGQSVAVNDTVVIHYRVDPPGSDANVPLSVNAPGGNLAHTGKPGVLVYRPSQFGNIPVELTWGNLQVRIPINVRRAQ
jgi:hypothetical protein